MGTGGVVVIIPIFIEKGVRKGGRLWVILGRPKGERDDFVKVRGREMREGGRG